MALCNSQLILDVNGIDGSTVRQTTDNSVVIVDNSDPPPFGVGNRRQPPVVMFSMLYGIVQIPVCNLK